MPRLRTWFSPQLPAYITVDISDEFEFVLRRSVTFSTSSCTSITCWLGLIAFHSSNTVSILVSDVVDCSNILTGTYGSQSVIWYAFAPCCCCLHDIKVNSVIFSLHWLNTHRSKRSYLRRTSSLHESPSHVKRAV